MSTPRVKALLKERKRRDAFPDAVDAALASLFPRQREFVLSPAKRKENHAGRRSGKTNAVVPGVFMKALQFPGSTIPVFERTLSCVSAESFWQLMQEFDNRFKLGVKFHHTLKTATLPNKTTIAILGADTIEAADKHRGGKHPVVVVDEAGTYRSKVLEYLLTDVAEPATMDLDGEIWVLGTPGLVPTGAWFTITQSSGWEHYHWDVRDNPTLGPADLDDAGRRAWRVNWLDALRNRHGWTEETPRYRREYLGLWTTGLDDQIYRFDRNRNVVTDLPYSSEWTYALAMDLGFNDPTAFVVWARRPGDPNKYVVESYEQSGLIPSAVAAHVERLRARYSFRSIIADTGGYGKAVAEEMVQRHNIPVRAAAKRDKRIYIEHTNGDLVNGRIKIVSRTNQTLIEDLTTLGWDDERVDSAPGSRDHLPDAFLYGDREIRSWWDGGEREGPTAGSEAWFALQEQQIEDALLEQHAQRRGRGEDTEDWREAWYTDDAA